MKGLLFPTVNKEHVSIFAPAKINLYLHITGKRADGYHLLDSLVCFADIGDTISIKPAPKFSFEVKGPFAHQLSSTDILPDKNSTNLVVRAAILLAEITKKPLQISITLTKNLPVAAGLGGGSSNAAATIWGLLETWNIPHNSPFLPHLLEKLGADVPACMACRPLRMEGIGDLITPLPLELEIPVLLINPLQPCPTANVFLNYERDFKKPLKTIDNPQSFHDFIIFLKQQNNDLYKSASRQVPTINNVLNSLTTQHGCALARMSGSGATCFGLFETMEDCTKSARDIQNNNPDWWVQAGLLNHTLRY